MTTKTIPKAKRQRGPDKVPRRLRTDNPGKNLPHVNDARRIAKAAGKHIGRPFGSRTGWTAEETALCKEVARVEAEAYVALMTFNPRLGRFVLPDRDEAAEAMKAAVSEELLASLDLMVKRRTLRLARKKMPRN
ncbi:hypothetical protein NOV72_03297 [Caballeronia novacaledonica]|uniref:Uncharacterized protein n=1 Tax=Caballeronia novacaledonica TaxID=1544861 RepID=A0A2U3I7G6_9BURK|nr:hypothetical protein [Caballeronia novacaledonica]SPB16097.1 hypothetical protein NOV72_03297 [Caballeronia novacaledonica]